MKSQKFRNKITGEIATIIPILSINDWEKYYGELEPGETDAPAPENSTDEDIPR